MASITKRPRNKRRPWTVQWRDSAGKHRETAFATKGEANDYLTKLTYEQRAGIFTDPRQSAMPFVDYARQVLAGQDMRPGTRRNYAGILERWVTPWANGRTLRQVAEDREGAAGLINDTMRDDSGKLLSEVRRGQARTILTLTADEAMRAGRLASHKLAAINIVSADELTERTDFVFPDHTTVKTLADSLNGFGLVVWLARGCGLRARETLGVHREDFRDHGRTLRVSRQASIDGRTAEPLKHRRAGQFRDVPVPSYVWAMVRDLPPGPVLSGDGRTYLTYDQVQRALTRQRNKLGIPAGFTLHSLRHAYVSALLSAGQPITSVAAWLGHQSIQVTFRTYAHLLPSAAGEAREALDAEYRAWSAENAH